MELPHAGRDLAGPRGGRSWCRPGLEQGTHLLVLFAGDEDVGPAPWGARIEDLDRRGPVAPRPLAAAVPSIRCGMVSWIMYDAPLRIVRQSPPTVPPEIPDGTVRMKPQQSEALQ